MNPIPEQQYVVTSDGPPKVGPTTLAEWAAHVSEIANQRGWDRPDWDTNFPAKMAFVLTEIVELAEATHQKEGVAKFGDELADVAIRLLSILHSIWPAEWSPGRTEHRRIEYLAFATSFQQIEVLVFPIVRQVADAIQRWRRSEKRDAMIACELALLEVARLSDGLGFGLMDEIRDKSRENATRPRCHGLAQSVG